MSTAVPEQACFSLYLTRSATHGGSPQRRCQPPAIDTRPTADMHRCQGRVQRRESRPRLGWVQKRDLAHFRSGGPPAQEIPRHASKRRQILVHDQGAATRIPCIALPILGERRNHGRVIASGRIAPAMPVRVRRTAAGPGRDDPGPGRGRAPFQ